MHLQLARPTVPDLQAVFSSLGLTDHAKEFGLTNHDYFHVDQFGAALYFWGAQYGLNLQAGYVPEGQRPLLVPHPNEEPTTVVSIQHQPGHFSSLRPIGMGSESKVDCPFVADGGSHTVCRLDSSGSWPFFQGIIS